MLATTIDKYCYLTCRYLPPFFEHKIRVVYSKIENCHSIDEIGHPAIREVLRFMEFDRGVEIHHDGDLPARSGMGSSSAFTVGLLHALYALKGTMPGKTQARARGHSRRAEPSEGDGRLAGPGLRGLRRLQPHPVLSEREISVTPVTIPPGPAQGAELRI